MYRYMMSCVETLYKQCHCMPYEGPAKGSFGLDKVRRNLLVKDDRKRLSATLCQHSGIDSYVRWGQSELSAARVVCDVMRTCVNALHYA